MPRTNKGSAKGKHAALISGALLIPSGVVIWAATQFLDLRDRVTRIEITQEVLKDGQRDQGQKLDKVLDYFQIPNKK